MIVTALAVAAVAIGSGPASAIVGGTAATSESLVPSGRVSPNVIGGDSAGDHAYGWMVRLSVGCDGALIAPRVVLTAAHCTGRTGQDTTIQVTGGSSNLGSANATTVRSTYVTRASGFRDATRGDDWALIQLAKPFELPLLALTDGTENDQGEFRVLGWGSMRENGMQQTRLRTAHVPFVPDSDCRKAYHGNSFVESEMICAGNLRHGGVDACQGDSGGPMVRRDEAGEYVEVGIVSWGYGCARAGYPGVYTQVSAFSSAIASAAAKLQ